MRRAVTISLCKKWKKTKLSLKLSEIVQRREVWVRGNTGLKTGGDWKLDNVLSWLIAWDIGIPGSCHGHESYFCMYGYSKKKEADGCRKFLFHAHSQMYSLQLLNCLKHVGLRNLSIL